MVGFLYVKRKIIRLDEAMIEMSSKALQSFYQFELVRCCGNPSTIHVYNHAIKNKTNLENGDDIIYYFGRYCVVFATCVHIQRINIRQVDDGKWCQKVYYPFSFPYRLTLFPLCGYLSGLQQTKEIFASNPIIADGGFTIERSRISEMYRGETQTNSGSFRYLAAILQSLLITHKLMFE